MSILNYRLQGDHFSDLVAIEQANINNYEFIYSFIKCLLSISYGWQWP